MRYLITGSDGFIGTWLSRALLERGDEVIGISRRATTDKNKRTADITNLESVTQVIQDVKPDVIIHLAAQSVIPVSFEHPVETMETNVTGSLHILEAVRAHAPQCRVISVGSSAEYGKGIIVGTRIPENKSLQPMSPYGISKATQGMYSALYAAAYNIQSIHVRPFAILGPGKKGDAIADFSQGIVKIENEQQDTLRVGNLTPTRDIMDVRDFVNALLLVTEKGTPGEIYNLCNGTETTVQSIMDELVKAAKKPVVVETDPEKFRPVDDPWIVGDNTKIISLGYTQKYTLAQTISDVLEYWRSEN